MHYTIWCQYAGQLACLNCASAYLRLVEFDEALQPLQQIFGAATEGVAGARGAGAWLRRPWRWRPWGHGNGGGPGGWWFRGGKWWGNGGLIGGIWSENDGLSWWTSWWLVVLMVWLMLIQLLDGKLIRWWLVDGFDNQPLIINDN